MAFILAHLKLHCLNIYKLPLTTVLLYQSKTNDLLILQNDIHLYMGLVGIILFK